MSLNSDKNSGRNVLSRRLGPGAWEDADGALHFSVIEILDELGVEDTPENRQQCSEVVLAFIEAQSPGAKIVRRDQDCPFCGHNRLRICGGEAPPYVLQCLACGRRCEERAE